MPDAGDITEPDMDQIRPRLVIDWRTPPAADDPLPTIEPDGFDEVGPIEHGDDQNEQEDRVIDGYLHDINWHD